MSSLHVRSSSSAVRNLNDAWHVRSAEDGIVSPLVTQAAEARIVSRIARITCHQPSRQICLDDVPLDLTTMEYEIMARLVQSAGTIVERKRLISELFNGEFHRENRALDMHISNLRRKLGHHSFLIVTARGIGYMLRVSETNPSR